MSDHLDDWTGLQLDALKSREQQRYTPGLQRIMGMSFEERRAASKARTVKAPPLYAPSGLNVDDLHDHVWTGDDE